MLSSFTHSLELDDSGAAERWRREICCLKIATTKQTYSSRENTTDSPADGQTFHLVHSGRRRTPQLLVWSVVVAVELCRLCLWCLMMVWYGRLHKTKENRAVQPIMFGMEVHTHIRKVKRKNSLPTRRCINNLRVTNCPILPELEFSLQLFPIHGKATAVCCFRRAIFTEVILRVFAFITFLLGLQGGSQQLLIGSFSILFHFWWCGKYNYA